MGEVLGYILVIGLMVYGWYTLVKDGKEKGIMFVIMEILGAIVLAALGL